MCQSVACQSLANHCTPRNIFSKLSLSIDHFLEIDATLPTTEEDCRLWTFFLNGEELSKETCLRIVHDHDARQAIQIMMTYESYESYDV